MGLSFNAIRILRFNAGGLSTIDNRALSEVLIPEDIEDVARMDGFVPCGDHLSPVVRCHGAVILRHGRATKSVTRRRLAIAVRARAEDTGMPETPALVRAVHEDLLRKTPHELFTYPVILCPVTGFAIVGAVADQQLESVRHQLQMIAPDLDLRPVPAHRVGNSLSSWMEDARDLPYGMGLGRRVVLEDVMTGSMVKMRDVPLPDMDVLTQIRERHRIVRKLGATWEKSLSLVVEDPFALTNIAPVGDMKARLDAVKNHGSEMLRIERQTAIWLEVLRPLLRLLAHEFAPRKVADERPSVTVAPPFIFDGVPA